MSTPLTFLDCCKAYLSEPEAMAGYWRLTGSTFGRDTRSGVERMVDAACETPAATPREVAHFCAWVYEVVWCRLPVEVRDMSTGPEAMYKAWDERGGET